MNDRTVATKGDMRALLTHVDEAREQIARYLPDGVSVDRFMAHARRAIAEQPRLAECGTGSVMRALAASASSGLPLDGQFSSLIIRKAKNGPPTATWDPTYRGMIALAMSSGFVSDVQSFAVTEHDEFAVEFGTEPKVRHIPALLRGGRLVAAYAWARLTNGRLVLEVVGRDDLDKIKRASPAGERGPWGAWESQMARKSAVRRLLKKLPASPLRTVPLADDWTKHADAPAPAALDAADAVTGNPEPILPEVEHALECRALERLGDATTVGELSAAYAQSQVECGNAGIAVPAAVDRRYRELRDELEAGAPDDAVARDDEWLNDYNGA